MGELESQTVGTSLENAQWHVYISLDCDGPMSGQPINAFTTDNLFDNFDDAVARAAAIRADPHAEVDYPLEPGQSVNVKIDSYEPLP